MKYNHITKNLDKTAFSAKTGNLTVSLSFTPDGPVLVFAMVSKIWDFTSNIVIINNRTATCINENCKRATILCTHGVRFRSAPYP